VRVCVCVEGGDGGGGVCVCASVEGGGGGSSMHLVKVTEGIGLGLKRSKRFNVRLLVRCVRAPGGKRDGDGGASPARSLFDASASSEDNQVCERHLALARGVELGSYRFELGNDI
jgi:hypothetical protein